MKHSTIKKPTLKPSPRGSLPSASGFIALGKGARSATPDSTSSSSGIKREVSHGSLSGLVKKARLSATHDTVKPSAPIRRALAYDTWLPLAIEVNLATFVEELENARQNKDKAKRIEQLMCGLIKKLHENRAKTPDPLISALLCYLCSEWPSCFHSHSVIQGFCSLMRKSAVSGAKSIFGHQTTKPQMQFNELISHVIALAVEERSEWPDYLVQFYMEDALSERFWVDRPECSRLVNLIESAFETQKPSIARLNALRNVETSRLISLVAEPTGIQSVTPQQSAGQSPVTVASLDDLVVDDAIEATAAAAAGASRPSPRSRFDDGVVRAYVLETLRDVWSRRPDAINKQLVKTMQSCCGYVETRLAASQKIDIWLQNPKLQRVCIDLMLCLAINVKDLNASDQEAITNLLKVRLLKSKPLANCFCFILKELMNQGENYVKFMLKSCVCNEFAPITARSANNMLIFSQCFQQSPARSAKSLAEIFFEFLVDKEEYSRNLRLLLREIVRTSLKHDFPFNIFCEMLCSEKLLYQDLSPQAKERVYHSVEDLLTLSILLGISPAVKDAALMSSRTTDKKDFSAVRCYQFQVQLAQKGILAWLQNVVPTTFRPSKDDYVKTFFRIIFLDKAEYYSKDGWPSEQERNLFLKIILEAPINEDILLKICLIGLLPNLMLHFSHAIELIDQLIRKVASAHAEGRFANDAASPVCITKMELIEFLITCCNYRVPDNTIFPPGYNVPVFCITVWYWRVLTILLMLASYNPQNVGLLLWQEYPTMRLLMQMVMIEDYSFPPASDSCGGVTNDEMILKDSEIADLEKREILEMENYLAAASTKQVITETNSHLLSQIMRADPKGPARRPPAQILLQIKQLNEQFSVGLRLCKSRDPDFLLEIVNRQGASHSLPWLVRLIQKNEGSLSVLPIECLCEFMLYQIEIKDGVDEFRPETDQSSAANLFNEKRTVELRQRLRNVLWSAEENVQTFCQTFIYFLNRLQAETALDRETACKSLNLLLAENDEEPGHVAKWLNAVAKLPHFEHIKQTLCIALFKSLLHETDCENACLYINFAESCMAVDKSVDLMFHLPEIMQSLTAMICGRRKFFKLLIPSKNLNSALENALRFIMRLFVGKIKYEQKSLAESQRITTIPNAILIEWADARAELDAEFVHANFLLLSLESSPEVRNEFEQLMDIWFPRHSPIPKAHSLSSNRPDKTTETDLIPHWIKSELLRCRCERIVDIVADLVTDSEVVSFLQNFGLPSKTSSKLLKILDDVSSDKKRRRALYELDEKVSTRLVEFVKFYRSVGCEGGKVFLDTVGRKFIAAHETPMETIESMETQETPQRATSEFSFTSTGQLGQYLMTWLQANSEFLRNSADLRQFHRMLLAIFDVPNALHQILHFLVTNSQSASLRNNFGQKPDSFCLLLTSLTNLVTATSGQSDLRSALLRILTIFRDCDQFSDIKASLSDLIEMLEADQKSESKLYATPMEDESVLRKLLNAHLEPEPLIKKQMLISIFKNDNAQLFSLLPHEIRLDTLRELSSALLDQYDQSISGEQVVKFFEALVNLPRLCKGRDPKLPRHYSDEDLLRLTLDQLKIFVEYSVAYLTTLSSPNSDKNSQSFELKRNKTFRLALKSCTSLLISCLSQPLDNHLLKPMAIWLRRQCRIAKSRFCYAALLFDVYFTIPSILNYFGLDDDFLSVFDDFFEETHFKVDVMTERLINNLLKLAVNPESDSQMEVTNSMLRRLASKHPVVLLRQLPLISTSLRGNTTLTMKIYYNTNYLLFMTMVLDLLDSMRRHLFTASHLKYFEDIMNSFLEFIQAHALRNAKFVDMIDKIFTLLVHYHQSAPEYASPYFDSNSSLLQAASIRYPEIASLRNLMNRTSFALPVLANVQQSQQQAAESSESMSEQQQLRPLPHRPPSPVQMSQLNPLLSRLSFAENSDEILYILGQVQDISSKKPDCLPHFQAQLERLVVYKNSEIAKLSFELLMKHFSQSPRESRKFLATFLHCFDHDYSAKVAIQFIVAYCTVYPDDVGVILQSAYKYCIRNMNRDNLAHLTDCIEKIHCNNLYD